MSLVRNHLGRFGLFLVSIAAFAGCSSDGTGNDGGSISLALNPTSASVVQGGQATTAATLTRADGFTGTVNLTVTGQPTGVTATVSNVVTTGLVTTATLTVDVAASTAVGVYPIVLHGNGTGVTEATATYTLTVTAAPTPAVAITLSASAVSIVQGAATPTITVTLARTNFTGNVTLSVDGLPTGVTAAFLPVNPQTTNSSVLTLTVSGTAALGLTNLTVRAAGTGITDATAPLALTVTAPAASFTLSLTQAALSIPQAASAPTTTVNINRVNFTGDVVLSVLNLPTGVTASFAPANPQSGNSSVLTLTVAANAALGLTNLQVQGVGSTGTVTTPLALTVTAGVPTGDFSINTVPPTTVNVTQGASTDVAVNYVRTGGHTADITLTVTGLVTGLTVNINPITTGGNTATVTVTAAAGLAVGVYPIVLRANSQFLAEKTTNLSVNVVAPSGSGNVSVSFASCTAANKAVWLAYQDGTAGSWTRVTGVADVYQFNISQSKGGIAYVVTGTGTSVVTVLYFTQAELTAAVLNFCGATPTGKTVNGTVANLGGAQGTISFGGQTTFAFANGPFQLNNVRDGANDLIGYARFGGGGSSDRIFISRGLNPANGGSVGTVDFTGAGSFSAQAAAASVSGAAVGETVTHSMNYYTGTGANACVGALLYAGSVITNPPGTFTAYSVPEANEFGTDYHSISIIAANGTTAFRLLSEDFKVLTTRAATPFVLPSALAAVTPTVLAGPYKRLRAVTTLPADVASSVTLLFLDQTVAGTSVAITATAGWLGGLSVDLSTPDFSTTVGGGFLNTWAPGSSDTVLWTLSGTGQTLTPCTVGHRVVISSRSGTI